MSTDYAQARQYFAKAGDLGHVRAKFNLACLLYESKGGDAEPQRALSLLHEAAQQDDAAALYTLGRLHVLGESVEQDEAQALSFYTRAAALGDPAARFNLGYMYSHAQGTALNYTLALQWYRAAAGQETVKLGSSNPQPGSLRSANFAPDLRQAA